MQIGFFGLLALLFIGAKLFGAVTWAWGWVLAPIWGPFILMVFILVTMALSGNK